VVGNSSSSTANKKAQDDHPVDDFVLMEFDLAGDICVQVDSALASLKKVTISSSASIITIIIITTTTTTHGGMID